MTPMRSASCHCNYNGSTWDITGSSTGVILSGVSASAPTDCPSGAGKQFNITITNGGSVAKGDVVNFALIAASQDSNQQKKLQFGQSATSGSTWNNNTGRSKIEIDPTGGFVLKGKSDGSVPTLMDMMASAAPTTPLLIPARSR